MTGLKKAIIKTHIIQIRKDSEMYAGHTSKMILEKFPKNSKIAICVPNLSTRPCLAFMKHSTELFRKDL